MHPKIFTSRLFMEKLAQPSLSLFLPSEETNLFLPKAGSEPGDTEPLELGGPGAGEGGAGATVGSLVGSQEILCKELGLVPVSPAVIPLLPQTPNRT